MKARNPLLIYDVGYVVVLSDGKVTEENINNTAASTGCHRSSWSCLAFYLKQKETNGTGVLLLHREPST